MPATKAPPPHEGPQLPVTRRQRRAYASVRKREIRKVDAHDCALDRCAKDCGVNEPIAISKEQWHAFHRALGEHRCLRCPECVRLGQKLTKGTDFSAVGGTRATARAMWMGFVQAALQKQIDASSMLVVDDPTPCADMELNREEISASLAADTDGFDAGEPDHG